MADYRPHLHNIETGGTEAPFAVLASDINRYVLDNGMVILTKEVYPSKVVFLSLWARVGSSFETDEEAGIAHFVEHMLFKNTKKRGVGQVAQEIHALGGYLNGFTTYDCTAYWMVMPGQSLPKALEIQYDAIFNPLFDAKEVEKERSVILEEIKMYKDRPADYISQKLMETAFKKHRYGRPIIGFEETVKKVTPESLRKYYTNHYRPNNCFLLAVGDVDTLDIVKKCERTYRKLKEGKVSKNVSPKEPAQKRMRRIEKTGAIKTGHLQMAYHIPSIFDRNIYPVSLLSHVLGTGESSRLFRELRERRKLVNEISTFTYAQRDPSLLFIESELPPENIEEAEKAIFEIIDDIIKNGLDDREFQRAKNLTEANYIFNQETVEHQGRKIGYAEVMGDYMMVEKFIQRLVDVRKSDAKKAAARYLKRKNCTIAVYRPE